MLITTLTVDSFYPAPEAVTRIAKGLSYEAREYDGHTYTGVGVGFNPEGMDKTIGDIFGGPPVDIKLEYFRLGTGTEKTTSYIHGDSAIASWAAVWYLSEAPGGTVAGTAFWRHRELDIDAMPNLKWVMEKFKDKPKPVDYFIEKIKAEGEDESLWEMSGLVGQKYNRAALYFGNQFHSRYPKQAWGKDVNDGRLVWTGFFSRR
jgi:hypothetical protein